MMKLQDEITQVFLDKLEESSEVTRGMVAALRELLASEKKLKAEELVEVFAQQPGGEVK